MKVIVAGMGVQGEKRKVFAGNDFVASFDPVRDGAKFVAVGGRRALNVSTSRATELDARP